MAGDRRVVIHTVRSSANGFRNVDINSIETDSFGGFEVRGDPPHRR